MQAEAMIKGYQTAILLIDDTSDRLANVTFAVLLHTVPQFVGAVSCCAVPCAAVQNRWML
jgi:hypothetical protein